MFEMLAVDVVRIMTRHRLGSVTRCKLNASDLYTVRQNCSEKMSPRVIADSSIYQLPMVFIALFRVTSILVG